MSGSYLDFGIGNLFGIWSLGFGIFLKGLVIRIMAQRTEKSRVLKNGGAAQVAAAFNQFLDHWTNWFSGPNTRRSTRSLGVVPMLWPTPTALWLPYNPVPTPRLMPPEARRVIHSATVLPSLSFADLSGAPSSATA